MDVNTLRPTGDKAQWRQEAWQALVGASKEAYAYAQGERGDMATLAGKLGQFRSVLIAIRESDPDDLGAKVDTMLLGDASHTTGDAFAFLFGLKFVGLLAELAGDPDIFPPQRREMLTTVAEGARSDSWLLTPRTMFALERLHA
jgi:hypothetical protein